VSLRYEQYWALEKSKNLLVQLLNTKTRPTTVQELKRRALSCLRHFPPLTVTGKPIFSQDNLTKD